MGDTTLQPAYADFQHPHFAPSYLPPAQPSALKEHANKQQQDAVHSPVGNGEEEPYTIRCICGYSDDDGNTVLCEKCNTWQHISCYYYPKEQLEDDFHHICADCLPRREGELDRLIARQRQRRLREPINSDERKGAKRAPTKPRKSKTKDGSGGGGGGGAQTNGWTLHESSARDASPREQGPPAKKSKTSHKSSPSLSTFRNRSTSHLPSVASVAPPLSLCPSDWFSSDFIRIHRDNTSWEHTDTNISVNIAFSSRLGEWLDREDQFAADTNGRTHKEVFKRLAISLDEVPMPRWEVKTKEDRSAHFHGEHPIWKCIELQEELASGQMLGEITGSIGPRDEYKADAGNRWDALRHPDYFVFFHPVLPLYIDCRNEGTALRYVRRSCRPNLQMNTLITGERDIRFVFTAVEDIPAGSEVTIGWDTTGLQQYGSLEELAKSGGQMDMPTTDYLPEWAQTLLAHFGGCPCDKHAGPVCLMDHFDRRIPRIGGAAEARPQKNGGGGGGKKQRKASRKESPLPEHLLSRASSEAIARDDDDDDEEDQEMGDARSSTRSAGTGDSRDVTPNGQAKHFEHGLSEREKKKLMQQERLFEQMEHMEQHGQKRKKRPSGSNTHTPTIETSRQAARPFPPESPYAGSKVRSTEANGQRRMTNGHSPPRPAGVAYQSTSGASGAKNGQARHTRPVYVDASTQTETGQDKPAPTACSNAAQSKPRVGLVRKLFKKSLLRHVDSAAPRMQDQTIPDAAEGGGLASQPATPGAASDAESMEDVIPGHVGGAPEQAGSTGEEGAPEARVDAAQQTTHPPIKPPPPPWRGGGGDAIPRPRQKDVRSSRSPGLRMELPPPSFGSRQEGDASGGLLGHSVLPSPGASERLSPSILLDTSVTRPTPIKKKMSLSDYTKRRKTETPQTEKTQAQAEGGAGAGDLSRPSSEGAKSPSVERTMPVKQEGQPVVGVGPETPGGGGGGGVGGDDVAAAAAAAGD